MPMESPEPKGGHSRRSFLVKLGLGVAGLAGLSTGLVQFGKKEIPPMSQEFPGPDSIFHPARDPRTDPRRKQ
jgi:hypothetical protein